jgi:hypothetical protein
MAAIYGYLYVILTTMTQIFEKNYGFTTSSSGLTSLGFGLITTMILAEAYLVDAFPLHAASALAGGACSDV